MADTKTTAAKSAGGKSSAKKQKTTIRKKKAKTWFHQGCRPYSRIIQQHHRIYF